MALGAEVADRIQEFPRRRTYLLPALHEVQAAYGWLPGEALELVGAHLRVPKSEVFGIASSFPDFKLDAPRGDVLKVCMGASCRVFGGPSVAEATADCLFICGVGPASEVNGVLVGRSDRHSPLPEVHAAALVQDGSCSRAVADTAHALGTHVGCAGHCSQAPAI